MFLKVKMLRTCKVEFAGKKKEIKEGEVVILPQAIAEGLSGQGLCRKIEKLDSDKGVENEFSLKNRTGNRANNTGRG